jgi:hypothetical protein
VALRRWRHRGGATRVLGFESRPKMHRATHLRQGLDTAPFLPLRERRVAACVSSDT